MTAQRDSFSNFASSGSIFKLLTFLDSSECLLQDRLLKNDIIGLKTRKTAEFKNETLVPGEARTHDLEIMNLTLRLLRYGGFRILLWFD